MRAPISGIVKSVHVNFGSQLAKGDLMVKIE
jgi:biotin carboxyl carrier protein